MQRLPDFEAWAVFAKVAELGSFAAAAADLGLSRPTVSKAIARLETALGLALINRTSRRLSLTDPGRAALTRAMTILNEGRALEEEALAQSTVPRGRIRLSAPLSFGVAFLGEALADFMTDYPEITLDLALSDRHVDVVADGFDLAIRIASLQDSSLLARRLLNVRLLLVGAPAYFERRGRPDHPSQLEAHAGMIYTGGRDSRTWRFTHPQFGETAVEPGVHVLTDNADMLTPALIAGQGLALQPEFLVWRELADGRLEVAMPDWSPPVLGLYLLTPPSTLRPLRVRKLAEYLTRALARPPWALPAA